MDTVFLGLPGLLLGLVGLLLWVSLGPTAFVKSLGATLPDLGKPCSSLLLSYIILLGSDPTNRVIDTTRVTLGSDPHGRPDVLCSRDRCHQTVLQVSALHLVISDRCASS